MRRACGVAVVGLAVVVASPAPAAAHGLGGRLDLPVPFWLFVYGAAAVVVVSFVALATLWKEPRLEGKTGSRPVTMWMQRLLSSRIGEVVIRGVSLAAFLLVVVSAAAGPRSETENLAPVFVFVWFWVGLPILHALFGNLWAVLSPWDTLARVLGIGARPVRRYPVAWGKWPAAVLLLGFVWLELVYPSADPRSLAVAVAGYSAVTLGGMALFGRDVWNANGEAFAVYLGLLALVAPLARRADGRVVLRPPLGGLPSLRPQPGLLGFVVVVIGSTTFDGFTGTEVWRSWTEGLTQTGVILAGTAGLGLAVVAVGAAYALAMMAAAPVAGLPWHPLAVRFVHSLVPIAFAYVLAHYFSLLVLEGQFGIPALSDPLGLGWDLLGTAGFTVNLALLSAAAIWYVQVAAIVAGHVAGVVLAHDRSVAAFARSRAMGTQYALLAVMVMFTVGGLVVLSGG